jgi:hypothetical protein
MECNFSEAVWDRVTLKFQVHPAICHFQKGKIIDWIAAINKAGIRKHVTPLVSL